MSIYEEPLKKATALLEKVSQERQAVTDDFFTRESVIQSLSDVLKQQDQEVVYIQPAQPVPASPNYIKYAIIGFIALILFRKIRL